MLKRPLLIFLLATVVAVVHAGGSARQAKPDPFDVHCSNIGLLQAKPVQKDIGLTEAQRARLNVHAQWHQSQLEELDKEAQTKKLTASSPEVRKRLDTLFTLLKERCIDELKPAQVKRLGQITIQQIGDPALCDPVVAKKIGMSDAQLKSMQSTYQEGARKFAEMEREAAQKVLLPYKDMKPVDKAEADRLQNEVRVKLANAAQTAKPKLQAIRAEYAKRMKAILTSVQSKAFLALRGKPLAK